MKTYFKPITFALLVLAMLVGCKNDKNAKLLKLKKQQQELADQIKTLEAEVKTTSPDSSENSGVQVGVEIVKPSVFAHAIEVQGALDGDDNVKIFPQGQGTVTQVLVSVGSQVRKGQVIARLDDQAMRRTYAQTLSQYKLVVETFDRQKRLWDQKIGSEMQFLQAKTAKESLENGLAALKEQLDYAQIKSPINGTIEDLPLKVGMTASPAMPVATVINFSSIKVVADVAEAYNTSISTGDSVSLWFPDLKKEIKSKISSASKLINPQNRSFKVEVRLPGNLKNLKANMIAVLRITDYKNKNAMVVKVNLIQTDSKGAYVYAVSEENGKQIARKKYITQGLTYNGFSEVKDGLVSGDRLVSVGQLGLTDGAQVQL